MTVNQMIATIDNMENQTKTIRERLPKTISSNDEVVLTYSELLSLFADRQELINIYKRMEVTGV